MNTTIGLFRSLVLLLLVSAAHANTILLSDDFSGTELGPQWQTSLPFATSQVIETGGYGYTFGRGILASANPIGMAPYVINMAVHSLGDFEHFEIALRSDLTNITSYHEVSGLVICFANDDNRVLLQQDGDDGTITTLASARAIMDTGVDYRIQITDTGTSVGVSVNDVPMFAIDTSFNTGSYVAFYSREFIPNYGGGTGIDYVTIQYDPNAGVNVYHAGVPDTGTTLGYVGIALMGILWFRRFRRHGVYTTGIVPIQYRV